MLDSIIAVHAARSALADAALADASMWRGCARDAARRGDTRVASWYYRAALSRVRAARRHLGAAVAPVWMPRPGYLDEGYRRWCPALSSC